MRFRTEIDNIRQRFEISHDDRIVMLGSCFTDNVGARLQCDGFKVSSNPLGPLYNPLSIANMLSGLLDGKVYTADDFVKDASGVSHCLDYASRYQSADAEELANNLNAALAEQQRVVEEATVMAFTFGSSVVYSLTDTADGAVGNCHKFPASMFRRMSLDADKIVSRWTPLLKTLVGMDKKIILTVSPIRHLADGLHGNELSKARLLLACEQLSEYADYFPAYEIMIDDLRDYRFYAADMKHPSEVACDYIYNKFSETYFSVATAAMAKKFKDAALRASHRRILE